MSTSKLTAAQALVRYLCAQHTQCDGQTAPLFAGIWAIFGHGNVPALGEALHAHREQLPTLRGQCEQSMAHAAIAYAKQSRRQRMMACTSSIGPGATNMLTAAALAHVNRLPVLLLPGDTFVHRTPDPVLQQVEHGNDPTITANDCFRPVSAYFDRINKPEQLITSLPRAISVLTDPELCGPATICLPQDVQAEAFDFPDWFFEPTVHHVARISADRRQIERAVEAIKQSRKPVIVAGGGVHYSQAVDTLRAFVSRFQIPVTETSAGKGALAHGDPLLAGGAGVVGAHSANAMLADADLIITIGTRLSDFTTGSRSVVSNHRVPQININVAHLDAHKHNAMPLRSDARQALDTLTEQLGDYRAGAEWIEILAAHKQEWQSMVDAAVAPPGDDGARLSDAQATEVITAASNPERDVLVVAAGSMPAEGMKIWRSNYSRGYHSEYGFSCMGYEIAGGIGVKMADPDAEVFVVVGDGSYLMLNSEIVTSVMLDQKLIIVVLDNRGFGCINRLQNACGAEPFNNLIDDGTHQIVEMPKIDYAAHAASMGATSEHVTTMGDLAAALERAKASDKTYVIAVDTNPVDSTGGGSWWQVGVPEVSARDEVIKSRQHWQDKNRKQQPF